MSSTVKLKKGLNIMLQGEAGRFLSEVVQSSMYAVKPVDFPGLTPKLCVKAGEKVKAGTPLFYDKVRTEVKFTSPVSGTVQSIVRGEQRKLLEIVVEKTGNESEDFGKEDFSQLSVDQIKSKILASGLWPSIRQRPYNIIADSRDLPKAIFISGFDTAPLAPDYSFIMENSSGALFQSGLNILARLTDGKVNLILNEKSAPPDILKKASGVDVSWFSGPHPAGNIGVHIHHLNPINKGEIVWFINLQDVISLGRLFTEGIYRPEKIIALAGSEVINPGYYRITSGASVSEIIRENIKPGKLRFISGNVLTGAKIESDGYLGFYDSMVSVIPEGDYFEFFGWMKPGLNKFSFSRTFASKLIPGKKFRIDTNMHGGHRAFVMTGQYEKVLPMDIYPMQLLKAVLAEDIDMMENLGIYEVAEEDFALCEVICPSKMEIQSILRHGLDLMAKEMN
jgi:Na+-transporting NADH:ubiquinone oxidoreductase subunit A